MHGNEKSYLARCHCGSTVIYDYSNFYLEATGNCESCYFYFKRNKYIKYYVEMMEVYRITG
jgi:hypothetical protein